MGRLILRIAPHTFGVYLLHEHLELRYRWPLWLGVNAEGNPVLFVLRSLGTVLLVFAAGILVDMVRALLFKAVGRLFAGSKINALMKQLDERIAGR